MVCNIVRVCLDGQDRRQHHTEENWEGGQPPKDMSRNSQIPRKRPYPHGLEVALSCKTMQDYAEWNSRPRAYDQLPYLVRKNAMNGRMYSMATVLHDTKPGVRGGSTDTLMSGGH